MCTESGINRLSLMMPMVPMIMTMMTSARRMFPLAAMRIMCSLNFIGSHSSKRTSTHSPNNMTKSRAHVLSLLLSVMVDGLGNRRSNRGSFGEMAIVVRIASILGALPVV